MKTIYKFGFKINENPECWDDDFRTIFGMRLNAEKVDKYENKEKNWNESFKNEPALKEKRYLREMLLLQIVPDFNRFQEFVYLTLVFEGEVNADYFKYFSELELHGFVDSFEIPFKEPDYYGGYLEDGKYMEYVELKNPIYIVEEAKGKVLEKFKEHKRENKSDNKFKIYYKIEYTDNLGKKYRRVLEHIFLDENAQNTLRISEHFHSVFVLFHRSRACYEELKIIDNPSKILSATSNKLNDKWPKERIKLFLLNRFINARLYNMTFFSILELNAQMNSIYNQIVIKHQKITDKYEKQYERVIFNFTEKGENMKSEYYEEMLEYLYAPRKHREKLLNRIKNFFEPTDAQIERLRSDNDSKSSMAIQWIATILSVIIFFWGMLTFWYNAAIRTETIEDGISLLPIHMPNRMLAIIIVTIALIGIVVTQFLIRNSSSTSKDMKEVIKNEELKPEKLNEKVQEINRMKKQDRKILLKITEALKLLTTHTILKIDSGLHDVDRFVQEIDSIRED